MKPRIKAILPLFLSSLALLGCSSPAPTSSSVLSFSSKEESSSSSTVPSSSEEQSSPSWLSIIASSNVDYGIVEKDPTGEITYEEFKAKASSTGRSYTSGTIYLKVEDGDGTNQYACPLFRPQQEYKFYGSSVTPITVEEWRIDWDHCDNKLSGKYRNLDNCFVFWDLVNAITLYDNSPYHTLAHFYETPLSFTFNNGGGGSSSKGGSYSFSSDQTLLYGEQRYPAAAKTVYKKPRTGIPPRRCSKGYCPSPDAKSPGTINGRGTGVSLKAAFSIQPALTRFFSVNIRNVKPLQIARALSSSTYFPPVSKATRAFGLPK